MATANSSTKSSYVYGRQAQEFSRALVHRKSKCCLYPTSRKQEASAAVLQVVALKVFSLIVQNQLKLEPEWIPRDLNERVDYLSHIIDYDNWQLNTSVFSEHDTFWGPHSVIRFAIFHNCQVPRYNSRCWKPGSKAVDVCTVN